MFTHQTLFSTKKTGWHLITHRLSDKPDYLEQVLRWTREAWGQLEPMSFLTQDILACRHDFYLVFWGEVMVGMFGLFKRPAFTHALTIDELDYLYIHPNFRSMGAGKAII